MDGNNIRGNNYMCELMTSSALTIQRWLSLSFIYLFNLEEDNHYIILIHGIIWEKQTPLLRYLKDTLHLGGALRPTESLFL